MANSACDLEPSLKSSTVIFFLVWYHKVHFFIERVSQGRHMGKAEGSTLGRACPPMKSSAAQIAGTELTKVSFKILLRCRQSKSHQTKHIGPFAPLGG